MTRHHNIRDVHKAWVSYASIIVDQLSVGCSFHDIYYEQILYLVP